MTNRYYLTFLLAFFFIHSFAQKYQLELSTGIINYQGDLQPHIFTFNQSRPAIGTFIKYEISGHFVCRAGLTFGSLSADDKFNRSYLQSRNLNFRTNVIEAQVALECYLVNIQEHKFSPYILFGIAGFHFNNYTYDRSGAKIYLHPLSTEGEGLDEYPGRKKYKLSQAAIPFGEGILYKINCNLNISAEFCQRKLFTDYLDDVSTRFIDGEVLLKEKGAKAVEVAYRGDELAGGLPYPVEGYRRGNSNQNDWYYTATIKCSIGLFNCNTGNFLFSGIFGGKNRNLSGMRCPRVF
jgi:Domain of unknown function (DUF6089)